MMKTILETIKELKENEKAVIIINDTPRALGTKKELIKEMNYLQVSDLNIKKVTYTEFKNTALKTIIV